MVNRIITRSYLNLRGPRLLALLVISMLVLAACQPTNSIIPQTGGTATPTTPAQSAKATPAPNQPAATVAGYSMATSSSSGYGAATQAPFSTEVTAQTASSTTQIASASQMPMSASTQGTLYLTPKVVVADQAIQNGMVSISEVVSNGPGWLVIHAQTGGKPGAVIGYAPVKDGMNANVQVPIISSQATSTLYAMLHTDVNKVGIYEFPGPDVPVVVSGQMVNPSFNVLGQIPNNITPAVVVIDQPIINNSVTIPEVISVGPGWLVIHAQASGQPGLVLGETAVKNGLNTNVGVNIDTSKVTNVLYAMLHVDVGTVGTYEFPGLDMPVVVSGQIVSPQFNVLPPGSTPVPSTIIPLQSGTNAVPSGAATTGNENNNEPTQVEQNSSNNGGNNGVEPTETPEAANSNENGSSNNTENNSIEPTDTPEPGNSNDNGQASPEDQATVTILNGAFNPKVLTIKDGTTVIWVQNDYETHTVTADDGSFNSGPLSHGQQFQYTFNSQGNFPYHCQIHGGPGGQGMSGTIVVSP